MRSYKLDIYFGSKGLQGNDEVSYFEKIRASIIDLLLESQAGFSLTDQLGGYIRHNGTFLSEDSMKLTIIGQVDMDSLRTVIENIKREFSQESVLIVKKEIDVEYY